VDAQRQPSGHNPVDLLLAVGGWQLAVENVALPGTGPGSLPPTTNSQPPTDHADTLAHGV